MQPFSLKLLKSSNRKVRSGFLFPLACCFLSVAFYIPPHFSLPVVAGAIDASEAEGDRLWQQGNQQFQTRQFPAALNSWQQALQIYRALKNREGEGGVLNNLGGAYRYLGNYAKAIEYGQQSLTVAREIKDRDGEWTALGNLGIAYKSLGNYAKAIEYGQQSLTIAQSSHPVVRQEMNSTGLIAKVIAMRTNTKSDLNTLFIS
ncbi:MULTISPECIES: tetratricopeptide repeat protein [unclassified Microcoleus]|uniref:tetratricopeptide repeat protein n=1 Tax=unclassified Microcoleus TaxID=2642155 RepID=UPI002FD229E0